MTIDPLLGTYFDDRPPLGVLGEEYIDPQYSPASESPPARAIRAVLFGSSPDAYTQNYRLAQYGDILSASIWAPGYSNQIDTRSTIRANSGLLNVPMGACAAPSNTTLTSVVFSGVYVGDDLMGVNRRQFQLNFSPVGLVGLTRVTASDGINIGNYGLMIHESGNSWFTDTASLACGVNFRLAGPTSSIASTAFDVSLTARPSRTLPQILSQLSSLSAVPAICPAREPFTTFLNLFQRGPNLVEKLSGALLALAYHTYEQATG